MNVWEPSYDAHAAQKAALDEAAVNFNKIINKSMDHREVDVFVAVATMWISVAQVHATNMNTMALEAQIAPPKKTSCRCIRD